MAIVKQHPSSPPEQAPADPGAQPKGMPTRPQGPFTASEPSWTPWAQGVSRIGQVLIQAGVIDAQTEQKAAAIQNQNPDRKFGEILVHDLGVDHHEVFSRLARIYAFETLDLRVDQVEDLDFIKTSLKNLSDEQRARAIQKQVMPLKSLNSQRDKLQVITPDPTDREVLGIASYFGYRRTEICYCRKETVEALIARVGPLKNEFLDHVEKGGVPLDLDEVDYAALDEAALDAEINQSMLTNLVEGCLVEAVRRGSSDIHIIPQGQTHTDFYFRIDGKLQLWYTREMTKPEAIIAVVKDRTTGVDRFERDKAQDGFLQREIDGHLIRFRVSILPLSGSHPHRKFEDIVIRILDDRKVITDLRELGLQPAPLKAFKTAIQKPQGMIILTGPTGSGKSTTLNAALHHVMHPSLCVLTVEDPVEYVIRGARQIKIGPHLRFADAVRTILRHDPDIVMVGEIRDLETAETAIKLANTGHLTFSTLHTNDAPSVISRLYKMGIEPFLIASAVNIVIAQRLVPTLCRACKKPAKPNPALLKACRMAGMTDAQLDSAAFFKPVGCPACNGTGYKGRAGIHEALLFTRDIRKAILDSGVSVDEETIREVAMSQGMITLRQAGLARVACGDTTLQAILEVTSSDM